MNMGKVPQTAPEATAETPPPPPASEPPREAAPPFSWHAQGRMPRLSGGLHATRRALFERGIRRDRRQAESPPGLHADKLGQMLEKQVRMTPVQPLWPYSLEGLANVLKQTRDAQHQKKLRKLREKFERPGVELDWGSGRLRDFGDEISASAGTEEEARAMLLLAKERGWTSIEVEGPEPFKKMVAEMAQAEGIVAYGRGVSGIKRPIVPPPRPEPQQAIKPIETHEKGADAAPDPAPAQEPERAAPGRPAPLAQGEMPAAGEIAGGIPATGPEPDSSDNTLDTELDDDPGLAPPTI